MTRGPCTDAAQALKRIETKAYSMHCFESATGFKFVLNTDKAVDDMQNELRHLFSNLFVPFVVRNPLEPRLGAAISSGRFQAEVDHYVQSLRAFR